MEPVIIIAALASLAGGCKFWAKIQKKERDKKEREQAALQNHINLLHRELIELRKTPTSTRGNIVGRRINRQIKMIAVDGYHEQDEAERNFFRQVRECGGNGVINMVVRRQRGGFLSIQGDAVVLE